MVIEFENDTKKSHLPGTRFTAWEFIHLSTLLSNSEEEKRKKFFNGKQYSEIQIFVENYS